MKIQYKEKTLEIEHKMKISKLLKDEIENSEYAVVGAIFDNEYVNIEYEIEEDGKIELIDISSKEGMRIYKRTIIYIFAKALKEMYPNNKATVNYQLANATYCDLGEIEVTDEVIQRLIDKMRKIVNKNLPIKEVVMTREEAKKFYEEKNTGRGRLQYDLETNEKIYMHFCEDYFNYCYGIIANRTGITKIFEILKYDKGLLIRYPSVERPDKLPKLMQNKKIKWALDEYNDIHKILDINTVYRLNDAVENNTIKTQTCTKLV